MQFLLYEIKNLQDGGLTSGISETTHTKFSSKLDLAFCVLKNKRKLPRADTTNKCFLSINYTSFVGEVYHWVARERLNDLQSNDNFEIIVTQQQQTVQKTIYIE